MSTWPAPPIDRPCSTSCANCGTLVQVGFLWMREGGVRSYRALLLICLAGCRQTAASMPDASAGVPDLAMPDLSIFDLAVPPDLSPFPCGSGFCNYDQVCCNGTCLGPHD